MEVMFDSIELNEIPASARAVAGYVGGRWPTFDSLAHKWPDAHRLSIAINASERATCLDVESGDASNADAPGWVQRQRGHAVDRPVLYTSLSNVPALLDTLKRARIQREEIRLWTAHYTYQPHICGHACGLHVPADATQWTDQALGRNLDESLCSDTFFNAAVGYTPADEARWRHEYDQLVHAHGAWPAMRRRVLRRVMTQRRKLISRLAQESGWNVLNREARYRQLLQRTE